MRWRWQLRIIARSSWMKWVLKNSKSPARLRSAIPTSSSHGLDGLSDEDLAATNVNSRLVRPAPSHPNEIKPPEMPAGVAISRELRGRHAKSKTMPIK